MKTNTVLVLVSAIVVFVATGCAASTAVPVTPATQDILPGDYTFIMSQTAKSPMAHGSDGEQLPIQYPIDFTRHGHLLTVR